MLAAGAGVRLRPLTGLLPKALCPMGSSTLLDRALDAIGAAVDDVAVNVHHGRDEMLAHLAGRPDVHVSVEEPEALGTAGALGALRGWLDGRAALVVNADTVHEEDLGVFASGWDGERVRVLMWGEPPFGPGSGIVASVEPWPVVADLPARPAGLWEAVWRPRLGAGGIDVAMAAGPVVDCGTPADYLRANLWLNGGRTVVGEGAVVRGTAERCVVWPGSVVEAGEHLVDAIRAGPLTVTVET